MHGALDETSYVHVGKLIASGMARCLENHGVGLDNLTILDFGCGPGCVANELKRLTRSCRLIGTDIDGDAIGWAQDHLRDVGTFETNAASPPTRFADQSFDLMYSISLFTHLDEPAQNLWLAELARILKRGETFVATTHGRFALGSCTSVEVEQLNEHGIAYRVDRKGRFKLDGLPDSYQTTFHTRGYVAEAWGRHFEVVDHIEGWLGDQDLVVLRRHRPDSVRNSAR